ncbi:MAG TPA: cyclic nucleotide-binding domain-containing protein [Aggregatilineales bacterium]|nr:cyclic nucleotide-binding domain-containing protein [Anaerolineales bacterium]HRE48118.1 cyclic nucleotide-binding domain-containing protein [Aggregatilineales bacterium]
MALQPLELLQRAFPTISREELLELAQLARVRTYPPETVLCREGAYEHILYLIAEGRCAITKRLTDHEDMFLRHAAPGDYVGEMAIISDAPRSATVTTLEEVVALEIDRELFLRILRQNAELAMSIIRHTFERLRVNDKNAIDGLREAYGTLEKLDKAKLDFIEVTAHELRTPLTIMRGYASMMLTDPAIRENPVLREMVEGVVNGSQRLHEIVNNMLDVQRIDMEQLNVASVPVSLPVVLRGVEMEFRSAIQQRKLNLVMDIARDTGILYIEADPGLLSKAMHHLLMNAIKYTPDGGMIRIKLAYEIHPEMGRIAHIQVADTGIGINKDQQRLIFEKFYRLGDVALHSSGQTAFKAGGPGLGLAIARGAAVAHSGQIWVDSEGYDEERLPGSTFHLLLPITPPKQGEKTAALKKPGRL